MNISAIRSAKRIRTESYYEDFSAENEDFSAEDEKPFGSVGEAFRPKFAAGAQCALCGKTHGLTTGIVRKWHKCTGCGTVYCDECGSQLPGKRGFLEAERTCPRCHSRTTLI